MPLAPELTPSPDKTPVPTSEVELFKMFQELMKDVDKRKKLVELMSGSRPGHWRQNTNSPYFKTRYAEELRIILDKMIETRQDIEYSYADFPRMSRSSLYQRVNQAKRFLLQELDPDKKYFNFCEIVAITREKTGIRLSIPDDLRDPNTPYVGRVVVPKSEQNEWQDKLDLFLENLPNLADGASFFEKKLSLSEDQIQALEASLMPLKNVVYSITYNTIKVVKMKEDSE